jgi:hypothetical protein
MRDGDQPTEGTKRKRGRRARGFAGAAFFVELGSVWALSGRPGGNIPVRCRDGHVFRTIWLPGVSVKSLRLGPWRVQRCPVGKHWTIVTPVRESALSRRERLSAHRRQDIRVP